ncbi:HigA family addiction module antitoxin [Paenibacillus sp.]|uniref:HigA family addiction module antitoxin n=1 Tax=Paenibacillus sp. TaxID=58172 RepID=UPI00356B3E0A
METNDFMPGIAIPPGETLQEALDEQEMTQKELALRLGCTPKHVNSIIKGTASITPDLAIKLETVLGIPTQFWLNLEQIYQESVARIKAIPEIEEEVSLLEHIPYTEISKLGWVPVTTNTIERIKNLRTFFKVASLDCLPFVQTVAFRKASKYSSEEYSLAAWINKAENDAKDIDANLYSNKKLTESLPLLRRLTNRPLKASFVELRNICASFGVKVVVLPHISKTHVNGATKWLPDNRALVMLSLRGAYEDIFWFTFFHEIGHVLQNKKTTIFIDMEEDEINDLEIEADNFSLNTLIPQHSYNEFLASGKYKDKIAIRKFCEDQGIHTGILVGRLMKDKLISFGDPSYQDFRRKIT